MLLCERAHQDSASLRYTKTMVVYKTLETLEVSHLFMSNKDITCVQFMVQSLMFSGRPYHTSYCPKNATSIFMAVERKKVPIIIATYPLLMNSQV